MNVSINKAMVGALVFGLMAGSTALAKDAKTSAPKGEASAEKHSCKGKDCKEGKECKHKDCKGEKECKHHDKAAGDKNSCGGKEGCGAKAEPKAEEKTGK